jgi:hypothetical protein
MAMALLCHACKNCEIARFATRMQPKPLWKLGLLLKKRPKVICGAPSSRALYQVRTHPDPAPFATALSG